MTATFHVGWCLGLAALAAGARAEESPSPALEVVAEFPQQQVTGVAVSKTGRIFVNFPNWSEHHGVAVAEVGEKGRLTPFPNADWNRADGEVASRFVCVQSVTVDDNDALWILDPASPMMKGVVEGGPKLLRVDLKTNAVAQVIHFEANEAPARSYLNDVRVDPKNGFAFVTDSGVGALLVVNVRDGRVRRALTNHRSVKPEPGVHAVVEKNRLMDADTKQPPQIASDGLALDAGGGWLYFKALTGHTLYRVRLADLEDEKLGDSDLAGRVETVARVPLSDGLEFRDGMVWITAIEEDGIARYDVAKQTLDYVIRDPRLKWPDSFAWGGDGALYVTTSQIHLMPRFNRGQDKTTEPYRVWKLDVRHPAAAKLPQLPGG